MKTNNISNEILEQIKLCDEKAIESITGYLEELYPSQYYNVLCAAAMGGRSPGAEKARELAKRTAGRIWSLGLVPEFMNILITQLRNPGNATVEQMESLSEGAAILIEEKIIRNGAVLRIAEAVADGIARMRELNEHNKINAIYKLKESVAYALPGSEGGDIPTIYTAIFDLARSPSSSPKCLNIVILNRMLRRIYEGDPNLERMMGYHKETIKKRIESALAASPKPLSDGDLNLPKPLMAVNMPPPPSLKANKGIRLIFRQKGN